MCAVCVQCSVDRRSRSLCQTGRVSGEYVGAEDEGRAERFWWGWTAQLLLGCGRNECRKSALVPSSAFGNVAKLPRRVQQVMMVGSNWRDWARVIGIIFLISFIGFFLGLGIYVATRSMIASLVATFGPITGYVGWRIYRIFRLSRSKPSGG